MGEGGRGVTVGGGCPAPRAPAGPGVGGLWEPVVMSRSRVALSVGVLLLLASCLLPCLPLLQVAGTSLPYQDPTPEMLQQHAANVAAAERRLAVCAAVAAALALLGLAALVLAYVWRRRRPPAMSA